MTRIVAIVLLTFLSGHAYAGQINLNGWEIATDTQGTITSMTFRNPQTTLRIESSLTFVLGDGSTPQDGSISFLNGYSRKMSSGGRKGGEVKYYWDLCNGFHTVWEYYRSINRVGTLRNNDWQNFLGGFCRVEIANGNELFGVVSANGSHDTIFVTLENARTGPLPLRARDCRSIQRLIR
jgi:hypothetical protein